MRTGVCPLWSQILAERTERGAGGCASCARSEVGAALPVDVLTYEEKTSSAILRVCSRVMVRAHCSPTLQRPKPSLEQTGEDCPAAVHLQHPPIHAQAS
ncbi:Ribonuclease P protein subunit p14 [Fukomys damarensis]|uniref:Ribonuclease P protein subunit p14 n=1 Tax=Fukomys damarensis TaxID=885580 RepID=A0A091D4T3_FUKDA|nr:Ribonuclease P protein subunit p14 [Fukomys damarensis]